MDVKKKIALYKTIFGITVGAGLYGGALNSFYSDNVEHLAEIPSAVRYSLYNSGYIEGKESASFIPGEDKVDDNITTELLNSISYLSIDLSINDDLSFLKYCNNLTTLLISNAECLTKDQLKILQSLNLYQIGLYFNNPMLHKDEGFDLSYLKDIPSITAYLYATEELEAITLINMFKDTKGAKVKLEINGNYSRDDLLRIDSELDKIVDSLNITDKDSEQDKLYKVINYINRKIRYDQDVANYLDERTDDKDAYSLLSSYYNRYDLSSIIFDDKEVTDGICINYANLFDIICLKVGLKSRVISGVNDISGHAWNVYYQGDEKYYVDLTSVDLSYINEKITQYLNTDSTEVKEKISKDINRFLLQDLTTHSDFNLYKGVSELDSNPKIVKVNYNNGLDGQEILKTKMPYKKYAYIFLPDGFLLVGAFELIKYIEHLIYSKYKENNNHESFADFDENRRAVNYDFEVIDLDNDELFDNLINFDTAKKCIKKNG